MQKFLAGFLLLSVVSVGLIWWSLGPLSSSADSREFVINQGEGLNLIATRLTRERLIRNRYVFILWSYYSGLNRQLQAGTFKLSPTMSTPQIIHQLSSGGSNDYWLKIIGGSRLEEITPRLIDAQEGYLFPDSYLIPSHYTPVEILTVISNNFHQKFTQAKSGSTTQLSDSQIVTLASLLEREARLLATKQTVAGILLNRLNLGMALQVDATVQYAKDSSHRPKKYWQPITLADLKISSPYNTYLHPGLPPAPICNPGYDSLYAAFHPTPSDYLFYITDPQGQMHYALTLDEHNQNVAKYLR